MVGGQFPIKDLERGNLRELTWIQAEFAGLQIITYANRAEP
jgi:hypothetical protein